MAILDLALLGIRAVQFVFAIIVLGLTGHVASYGATPSQDSFLLFTAIWTMLVLLYLALAPRFMPKIAHPYAILGLDALTMLFWFAGFIALAVFHHNLENDIEYDGFFATGGCSYLYNICPTIEAAAVFGAFEWALFVVTTVFAALAAFRNRGSKGTTMSEPTMTA